MQFLGARASIESDSANSPPDDAWKRFESARGIVVRVACRISLKRIQVRDDSSNNRNRLKKILASARQGASPACRQAVRDAGAPGSNCRFEVDCFFSVLVSKHRHSNYPAFSPNQRE